MADHPGPAVFRYAHDCFRADHRRTTLWDLFHARVRRKYIFEGEEDVMNGELPHAVVDRGWGEETRSEARMYDAETVLVMGSLFVTGQTVVNGHDMTLCSPLIIVPANLVERDGFLFARPDRRRRRINHVLLQQIGRKRLTDEAVDAVIGRLQATLSGQPITGEIASQLAEELEAGVGVDVSPLAAYPARASEKVLRRHRRETKSGIFRCVPATAVALINRSVSTRGILHELNEIAGSSKTSAPLRTLFSDANDAQGDPAPGHADVPAVLSKAQHNVLKRARTQPLSMAIGPPGTGKSFTIAAVAVEHAIRGSTVLVACKKDHAVDVVADIVDRQFGLGQCIVRAGRQDYLRDLKRYLEQVLSGVHTADAPSAKRLRAVERRVEEIRIRVSRLEKSLEADLDRHTDWGRILAAGDPGLWSRLRQRWIAWRVERGTALPERAGRLSELRSQQLRATRDLVRRKHQFNLAQLLDDHRGDLKQFLSAIRARNSGTQLQRMQQLHLPAVLHALPIWLVKMSDVSDILPLVRECFDLAIIDEASQCDVPSAIPVLHRARRALITGDPRQLRHISFLSTDRQQEIRRKHKAGENPNRPLFDYRNHSLLDVVSDALESQRDVSFLDEHFRSVPPIIEFSNERFYGGALRIMTEKPDAHRPEALRLVQTGGTRDARGVNQAEVTAIVDDVETLVESQASQPTPTSIGILSPFRAQVDALREAIRSRFTVDVIDRHDILVGTAHTFQGEERESMFLSWCVDGSGNGTARRFAERPDVFNVSVTRARSRQWSYASVDLDALGVDDLLGAYLRYVDRYAGAVSIPRVDAHDRFAEDVAAQLREEGYRVWVGLSIAGQTVDIVVETRGQYAGIDLIGYPGSFSDAIPLERYRMFGRAELTVVPLSYPDWTTDRAACIEELLTTLPSPHESASEKQEPAVRQSL
ncbi:hypothetical protein CRI94_00695 [Longibacter salinarum]|uniref:AAA family ATPase n=1 Tax=Longibacter salinarum TaxID=1850348 RepID=A0A2A8D212_9BACT|nr:AAA domain-containing protein [Longibacter salinarum]PEN14847.1 hypothetical protein CRI94_00695 [Longibacter salinarum]